MDKIQKRALAQDIAREVIDSSGTDPDYMTIVEVVADRLDYILDEDMDDEEYEALETELARIVLSYIAVAMITINFGEVDFGDND